MNSEIFLKIFHSYVIPFIILYNKKKSIGAIILNRRLLIIGERNENVSFKVLL
jgi:hypothetical protein